MTFGQCPFSTSAILQVNLGGIVNEDGRNARSMSPTVNAKHGGSFPGVRRRAVERCAVSVFGKANRGGRRLLFGDFYGEYVF